MILEKKIRVTLKSFNSNNLSECSNFILNSVSNVLNVNLKSKISCVSLPTNRRIYCVLRSPHSDKDSREHFEIKTYKKSIYVKNDDLNLTLKFLSELNLPINVMCKIELI